MFRKHIHAEDSQQYALSDPPKATSDVRVQQLDNTSIRKTHRPTSPTEVKAMCMNPREIRESNIILKSYPFGRFTAVMQHLRIPWCPCWKLASRDIWKTHLIGRLTEAIRLNNSEGSQKLC
eukprot:scaffold6157_cov120-Cyclotella_meneghiniana.AAC.3